MILILLVFVVICGILLVNERNEEFGLFRALKSLFMLLIVLGCMALTFTGVGVVVGVPVLLIIAKKASEKI